MRLSPATSLGRWSKTAEAAGPTYQTQDTGSHFLQIPQGVVWTSGPYAHQKQAVRAWEGGEQPERGVIAMATGAGKDHRRTHMRNQVSGSIGWSSIVGRNFRTLQTTGNAVAGTKYESSDHPHRTKSAKQCNRCSDASLPEGSPEAVRTLWW